jgi:hypothetical protein
MRTRTQESCGRKPVVGALLRLLEYVHGEVSERLQDWRCAEQLETCIEHLKAECVL